MNLSLRATAKQSLFWIAETVPKEVRNLANSLLRLCLATVPPRNDNFLLTFTIYRDVTSCSVSFGEYSGDSLHFYLYLLRLALLYFYCLLCGSVSFLLRLEHVLIRIQFSKLEKSVFIGCSFGVIPGF